MTEVITKPGFSRVFPASKLEDISIEIRAANKEMLFIDTQVRNGSEQMALLLSDSNRVITKEIDSLQNNLNAHYQRKALLGQDIRKLEIRALALLASSKDWPEISNTAW